MITSSVMFYPLLNINSFFYTHTHTYIYHSKERTSEEEVKVLVERQREREFGLINCSHNVCSFLSNTRRMFRYGLVIGLEWRGEGGVGRRDQ